MTDRLQAVALTVSVTLLLVVLELVRRKRLAEEYSFLWIGVALVLLGVSSRVDMLRSLAGVLGVDNPGIALVLLLVLVVFVSSLWFSVIVSRQRRQIERLIEETAILSAELRDLRSARLQPDLDTQTSTPNRPRA